MASVTSLSLLRRSWPLALALLACGDPTAGVVGITPEPGEDALSPKQLLGKRLFEDVNLSEPRGQACASCHQAAAAFTGNAGSRLAAVALGSRSEVFGSRNAPTAMYASFSPRFSFRGELDEQGNPQWVPSGGQFWDGRAGDLAAQARGPFLNALEMNNPDKAAVVSKVRAGHYAQLFRTVYGEAALDDVEGAYAAITEAIAAFEATPRFHPFSSRFDQVLRGEAQLDAQEARGLELFQDPQKGNCLACHAGLAGSRSSADWLFTDFTYDALGVPRNRELPANSDPAFQDLGLCAQEGLAALAPEGFDLESLCGAFKVPTLRNVAVTGPYMHNGVFAELREVVRFYVTRDTHPDLWYPLDDLGQARRLDDLPARYQGNVNTSEVPYDRKPGEAPRLTEEEIDQVVAFLLTLTDL